MRSIKIWSALTCHRSGIRHTPKPGFSWKETGYSIIQHGRPNLYSAYLGFDILQNRPVFPFSQNHPFLYCLVIA